MAVDYNRNTIGSIQTAITELNAELQKIESALEDAVSRSGNTPNNMDADLDMDSNRILNVADPTSDQDAATKKYVDNNAGSGGTGAVTSVFGRTGGVVAESGDYTTDQVTEGSNLYYTTTRVLNDVPVSSVANKTGAVSINPSDIEQEGATDGQVIAWNDTAGEWQPTAAGGAPVDSVFGRTGAVTAQVGDYDVTDLGQTGASDGQTIRWSDFNGQWEPAAPGGAPVDSVFGRVGFVTAESGDYTTGQVTESTNLYFTNARAAAAAPVQGVAGKTGNVVINPSDLEQEGATDGQSIVWNGSTNQWEPQTTSGGVSSVFGRTGDVTAQSGDYNTDQVTEGSNLYFTDARAQNAVTVPVDSVFGRTGSVTAQTGDYLATQVPIVDNAGNFSSSTVEGALSELSGTTDLPFVTPEDYGAVGDGSTDDTSALQNALNSGSPLYLLPKTYRITNSLTSSDVNIVIQGAGNKNTLIFCDNTDGFVFTQSHRYSNLVLRDFGLITNANEVYTAIRYNGDTGTTGDQSPKVVENVIFFGEDRHNLNPSYFNGWKYGIRIDHGDTFNISYCYFQGPEESRPLDSPGTNTNTYAVYIDSSTRVSLNNSMILIFKYGVYVVGQSEGVRLELTNLVACGYGVYGDNLTNPANAFKVKNCHISCYVMNVGIGKGTSPETQLHNIIGCVFFKRADSNYTPFHHVDMNVRNSTITDNTFRHGGAQDPTSDRTIVLGSGSDTVLVHGNMFFNQDRVVLLNNTERIGIFNNVVNDDGNSYSSPVATLNGATYTAANNIGDRLNW